MNGYTSSITCPNCGDQLDVVQEDSVATPARRVDILRCRNRNCGTTYAYIRELAFICSNNGCGSDAGYQRHRRNGETPCEACRRARAEAKQLRSQRQVAASVA